MMSAIWPCCLHLKNQMLRYFSDSDTSDDVNWGLMHCLPRSLFNSACGSSLLDKQNKENTVKTRKILWKQGKAISSQTKNQKKKSITKNVEEGHWFATNVEGIRVTWCTRRMYRNHKDTYWCLQRHVFQWFDFACDKSSKPIHSATW